MEPTIPATVCEPFGDTLTETSTDTGKGDTSDCITNLIPGEEDDVVVTYENIPSSEEKKRAERHSLPERFFAERKTKSGSTKPKRLVKNDIFIFSLNYRALFQIEMYVSHCEVNVQFKQKIIYVTRKIIKKGCAKYLIAVELCKIKSST